MSVTTLNAEERIAVAICWLYRWRGSRHQVPAGITYAVTERHGLACDWCDFPMAKLIELCTIDEVTGNVPPNLQMFKRFPKDTQREMVDAALHEHGA